MAEYGIEWLSSSAWEGGVSHGRRASTSQVKESIFKYTKKPHKI